jgi:hypothetical protein
MCRHLNSRSVRFSGRIFLFNPSWPMYIKACICKSLQSLTQDLVSWWKTCSVQFAIWKLCFSWTALNCTIPACLRSYSVGFFLTLPKVGQEFLHFTVALCILRLDTSKELGKKWGELCIFVLGWDMICLWWGESCFLSFWYFGIGCDLSSCPFFWLSYTKPLWGGGHDSSSIDCLNC